MGETGAPTVAWIDAPAGLSGDMMLGALVDAGLPVTVLEDVARRLDLEGVEVRTHPVMRGAIAATKVDVCRHGVPIEGKADVHMHAGHHTAASTDAHREVATDDPVHGHRTLADVLGILARLGDLEEAPLSQAAAAFRALAEAEARVHGTTVDAVHFHEVGANDALVDIAGTVIGLHHLGVRRVLVSPLPWGRGTVESAHGRMPLPAPATVRLLEGLPTVPSTETYEQVTPTGAALARVLSAGSEVPHGFVPRATGHGAGSFDASALPNVVRLVLGEAAAGPAHETVVLLETNLDDVTGQVAARALEQALAAGALDAWWAPVHMKKGRPGLQLSVLVEAGAVEAMEALLFRETPTLGVRRRPVERSVLARRFEEVDTPYGRVRLKVRETPLGVDATPEYEVCVALAEAAGVPARVVIQAAQAAYDGA